jgi:hypothetical protein
MRDLKRWSKLLNLLGGISLVVGSLDPMEGSVLILPGSALLALGSRLGHCERRIVAYRAWSFGLIALGVGSLFFLSAIGGVGGNSGRSAWWALLVLPYLVGWSIEFWGPGAARWISVAGVVIGAQYLAILGMMLYRTGNASRHGIVPAIAVAAVGIVTITACIIRLFSEHTPSAEKGSM